MKTTLDVPDELMRTIKVRAAQEDRKLKDVITELLRHGLAQDERVPSTAVTRRVRLPLVQCAHPARHDQEITPDRVAEVLLEEEGDWASGGR